MIDVFVLDGDLKIIGIIDAYKSLIWAKRYRETGDCELYIPATRETIGLLKKGRYLARLDDDMICRINKLQVTTSAEEGDFITATGTDTKGFLDQRIIWGTATCSGNIEDIARALVEDSCITPDNPDRALAKSNDEPLVILDTAAGLSTIVCEQVSYKTVGEKIREYCASHKNCRECRFYIGVCRLNDLPFNWTEVDYGHSENKDTKASTEIRQD